MTVNVTVNLALTDADLSRDEAARFFIALGKACLEMNVPASIFITEVSKLDYHILAAYMQSEGITHTHISRVYEQACGTLFGCWP